MIGALREFLRGRPWMAAAGWLAFLAPFFFLTYNFANDFAASRAAAVPVIRFEWERFVPFVGWTILPYWSSDLLYGLSLFLCRTRVELWRHAGRLVAIQVFSVACFIAFPLRCELTRPEVSGWVAWLFDSLLTFDRPFNQAPSLHVSLAVILWAEYRKHLGGVWRWMAAVWFVLIAVSAWTTYQHHFIDLPAGLWAGVLVLAVLPSRMVPESRRVVLAGLYLAGAVVLCAAAFWWRSWAWVLLWPSVSLSLVAAAYWTGDPGWLGKRGGWMPVWMWPYVAAAWVNSRLWTRGQAANNRVAEDVWIGRAPSSVERAEFAAVVDLTAELPLAAEASVAMLDLSTPTCALLDEAVRAIDRVRGRGPVLVCCALGYSRSALVAAAWLVASGYAVGIAEAVAMVWAARPQVVLRDEALARLKEWAERGGSCGGGSQV